MERTDNVSSYTEEELKKVILIIYWWTSSPEMAAEMLHVSLNKVYRVIEETTKQCNAATKTKRFANVNVEEMERTLEGTGSIRATAWCMMEHPWQYNLPLGIYVTDKDVERELKKAKAPADYAKKDTVAKIEACAGEELYLGTLQTLNNPNFGVWRDIYMLTGLYNYSRMLIARDCKGIETSGTFARKLEEFLCEYGVPKRIYLTKSLVAVLEFFELMDDLHAVGQKLDVEICLGSPKDIGFMKSMARLSKCVRNSGVDVMPFFNVSRDHETLQTEAEATQTLKTTMGILNESRELAGKKVVELYEEERKSLRFPKLSPLSEDNDPMAAYKWLDEL